MFPVQVPDADAPLKIVAIGASAGGLDALERLFDSLPCDSGAAYVVIQHLSPDHKSMMANLLSRHTAMAVVTAEQDMPLVADRVHLIPPGVLMRVAEGRLVLTPKAGRTLTLPIDVFFQAMADDAGPQGVGIVLSGTGSDGTRGAGAVNEAGGLLIAQDPDTAKFDGMPRSVIASGLVDAVLPVEQIGARLIAHLRAALPGEVPPPAADADDPLGDEAVQAGAVDAILKLLLGLGGVDFHDYKPGTVTRRIARRMLVRQVAAPDRYLALLNDDRREMLALRRELLIPVTSFFRDGEAFEILKHQVIAPLVAGKAPGDAIRVWCAGVATGEEPYSIAMLFLEEFEQRQRWPSLKVFATDVEQANLDTAAAGSYPESIAGEVSSERLERFFDKRGTRFVVRPPLRQSVVFARHNLLADPPFTRMDLVVCRNALIYFKGPPQERAMRRLQYALAPAGHLFLGSSESLGELQPDFAAVSARHKIFQVLRAPREPLLTTHRQGFDGARRGPSAAGSQAARHVLPKPASAADVGWASLLKAYAPPAALLVNAELELVHSFGEVHRFLRLRAGSPSLELSHILPDELAPVAAALLFRSARENAPVASSDLALAQAGGETQWLRLRALPAGEIGGARLALLVFEPTVASNHDDMLSRDEVSAETSARMEVLEAELAATRERLHAAIQDLEVSNEELQSTNEELMASNEELQSSNEELQSVNEELGTVNAEYQEKIDILHRLNADLENLTNAVSAGTVFVDEALGITRFSPDALAVFRLRPSDIGRPLCEIAHSLAYPALIDDLRRTLAEQVRVEREVRSSDGRHYFARILPYKLPSAARGAVLSFLDVTALHELSKLQAIMDALAATVAVIDTHGVIDHVNRAWRDFAADNGDPAMLASGPGSNYLAACSGPAGEQARNGINDVLSGRSRHFALEYPCHSPTEQRWFVMHVTATDSPVRGAVVSHINVSEWRRQAQRQ